MRAHVLGMTAAGHPALRDNIYGTYTMKRLVTNLNLGWPGMKLRSCIVVFSLLVLFGAAPTAQAQDEGENEGPLVDVNTTKRAQTGFKFMRTSVSARAAAMADAMTALEAGSIAMFYNPAGMAYLNGYASAAVGVTQFFADINYNAASIAFAPAGARYGVFGLSFMNVDYGDLEGTIRSDSERGYENFGSFSPTALMIGVGYAKALSDRFAVGGNVKYATQNLGDARISMGGASTGDEWQENEVSTVAFDIGVLYDTGFKSLKFAMSARNFSQEITYHEENFELPLLLTIGLSMDVTDLMSVDQNTHSFVIAADGYRPRDFYEAINIGGEYSFMNILSLRAGYVYPTDEQGINLGAGINTGISGIQIGADYAYTNYGLLGDVNRISLNFGF